MGFNSGFKVLKWPDVIYELSSLRAIGKEQINVQFGKRIEL